MIKRLASLNTIPIYIPCYNNYSYLKNMIEQLRQLNCFNIVVLDNNSTYQPLLNYLIELEQIVTVIYLGKNVGPRYFFSEYTFFKVLPPYFCVTDPDLEFNKNLPDDFILQLIRITEEYKIGKAGFCLDISEPQKMIQSEFKIGTKFYKIWDWESQFWQVQLAEEIYKADIDTTFAVYNKKYFKPSNPLEAIRVGGNFTCKHLPWYLDNKMPKLEEDYYRKTNKFSYYFEGVID